MNIFSTKIQGDRNIVIVMSFICLFCCYWDNFILLVSRKLIMILLVSQEPMLVKYFEPW